MFEPKVRQIVSRIGRFLLWLGSRVAVIYLAVFLAFYFFLDISPAVRTAQLRVLNRVIPTSGKYLIDLMDRKAEFDKDRMAEHLLYFQKVVEFLPQRADSHAMLGFCYFYAGQTKKALAGYERSVELNPAFFWSDYNLGLLYFKEGRYQQAVEPLHLALSTNPEVTLAIFYSSKVYGDIIQEENIPQGEVLRRLQEGYADARRLLVLSYYALGEYQKMFEEAARAIQLQQDRDGFFHYYAGLAAYHTQDHRSTVLFLDQFLKRNPGHKEALYHMAMAVRAMGQPALADNFMKRHAAAGESEGLLEQAREGLRVRIF